MPGEIPHGLLAGPVIQPAFAARGKPAVGALFAARASEIPEWTDEVRKRRNSLRPADGRLVARLAALPLAGMRV
jgi:hypothetical protein